VYTKRLPRMIHQLKITLRSIKPPIWRRIRVPDSISLYQLHGVLQTVMGWSNRHLHHFVVGAGDSRAIFSYPYPGSDWEDTDEINETPIRLAQITPGWNPTFVYEYDFGDGWIHDVVVEEKFLIEPGDSVDPICLEGARACPPEDVGGPGRYRHFLDALADTKNPEHDQVMAWIGRPFDPEAFDLAAVNAALHALTARTRQKHG